MKIALLGDVHANLPALEAVLSHAHEQGVEAIWNVGDWVGYNAFPDQVVACLRAEKPLAILGNYDLKVLQVGQEPEKKAKRSEKSFAYRWTYEHLSKESRKYLRALSREIRLKVEEKRVLLTHASPLSESEHITPETSDERLRELAKAAKADVIVVGHSHVPMARQVDGVWFINTGSVGRPGDGDWRACYAIWEVGPDLFDVHHYRLEYDVERAVAAIRDSKLPEAFAQMVLQGRGLEEVEKMGPQKAPASAYPPEPGAPQQPEAAEQPADGPPAEPAAEQAAAEPPEAPPAPSPEEQARAEIRQGALAVAETSRYDQEHAHEVVDVSLRLFDQLEPLHHLGVQERFWLEIAALLHDIGWVEGWKGHHKTSLRIILDSPLLPLGERERLIVGLIARYHRKALPRQKHKHYAMLDAADQDLVSTLAGMLRVADGLDANHRSLVRDLYVDISPEEILVRCIVSEPAEEERKDALSKGRLLEKCFQRKLAIEWNLV